MCAECAESAVAQAAVVYGLPTVAAAAFFAPVSVTVGLAMLVGAPIANAVFDPNVGFDPSAAAYDAATSFMHGAKVVAHRLAAVTASAFAAKPAPAAADQWDIGDDRYYQIVPSTSTRQPSPIEPTPPNSTH
jgi:hypothetical protein